MEYVEAGGAEIPKLGLGTWQNTGESCTAAVRTALEAGYRHIDTAELYDNEEDVGDGIAAAAVDREDIFLTTKVWRSNLRDGKLQRSVRESLDALDVEYVDLLLVHWPHRRIPFSETMQAMAAVREDGLARHIGVSNFTQAQLEAARDVTNAPIVCDQVLYNAYKDQSSLHQYCRDAGMALTAYSPLARGDVLSDETLQAVGERYDKTPAQVALRWLVQQDGVVAIPKATSPEHIEANLDVFDFELTDSEMQQIHELSGGFRAWFRNKLPALMRQNPV